jgi:CHAT domain-containing protein
MKNSSDSLLSRPLPKASALREAQHWLRDLPVAEARRLLTDKRQALAQLQAHERLAMIDLATARFDLEALAVAYDGKPFAHPYWWAVFQCLGTGWPPVAAGGVSQ